MKVPEPRKLNSGSYFIQLRLDGVSVPVTASTAKECRRQAELIKAEHRAGKRTATADRTLADLMEAYIDRRKNVLSPATVYGYQSIARTRFLCCRDKRISSIDWQKEVNREAAVCSPKTLKNAWGFVKSVLAENGMDVTVKLPAQIPYEKNWLDAAQIRTFLDAVRDTPGEVGALLALSSLRRSEIYALDWKDVDLDANVIHIHSAKVRGEGAQLVTRKQNKTQASTRDVPIFLDRLHDLLQAVEPKSGPVVTSAIGTLYDQIQTVCRSAGLPEVGVHGLRHSFASLCYSLGISELGAMQIGGWSDFQTMRKIYTHLSEADKKASAEKLKLFFKSDSMARTDDQNAN